MSFDRDKYWRLRNRGKRGQGERFNPLGLTTVYSSVNESTKEVSKKALRKHTKRAREQEARSLIQ